MAETEVTSRVEAAILRCRRAFHLAIREVEARRNRVSLIGPLIQSPRLWQDCEKPLYGQEPSRRGYFTQSLLHRLQPFTRYEYI